VVLFICTYFVVSAKFGTCTVVDFFSTAERGGRGVCFYLDFTQCILTFLFLLILVNDTVHRRYTVSMK
jgi:hypothetical protein